MRALSPIPVEVESMNLKKTIKVLGHQKFVRSDSSNVVWNHMVVVAHIQNSGTRIPHIVCMHLTSLPRECAWCSFPCTQSFTGW